MTAFNRGNPEESEDCLYLNVYAPSTPAAGDGRAVLYWIYGGFLQFGTAGADIYNGSFFAAHEDLIVVTVNYRTNGKRFQLVISLPLLLVCASMLIRISLWLSRLARTARYRPESRLS